MRKKNYISDHDMENLFRKLPKITDKRNRYEIFSRLKNTVDCQPYSTTQGKNRQSLWPVLATVATVFTALFIFFATFQSDKYPSDKRALLGTEEKNLHEAMDVTPMKGIPATEESPNSSIKKQSFLYVIQDGARAIYEDQLDDGQRTITLYIPEKEGKAVIPVSFIVKKVQEKIGWKIFRKLFRLLMKPI